MAIKPLSRHGSMVLAGRTYNLINKKYYKGRLPKCKFKIDTITWAWALCYPEGDDKTKHPYIQITPYMARFRDLLKQCLIHEIVHIAHPEMDHGDQFEQKMVDIRKKCFKYQLW